jgi:hypothetical protein
MYSLCLDAAALSVEEENEGRRGMKNTVSMRRG